MPEILAIEWEHEHVCGVLAHVSAGTVRVERTFVIPRPVTAASASAPLQLDWLRPELAKVGISGGPVLVALPRDEAIVKRLELPEVSDDELPEIVRLQAGAKSSVALDELALDFIPLPKRGEAPGREALVATVPRQTIDEIQTVCRSAGLEAIVIGLTAAAVAEFVARAEKPADSAAAVASLVVARHGNRIEISMLRRCHLLFSHSARLSSEASGQEAQAIVAEVSRALVALRGALSDVTIERIWTLVSAAEHEQLAESLKRRLNCEVLALDPFASVERDARVAHEVADRSLFAGPIGMLLAKSEPHVPALDFLSPRRPPVKRDVRQQRKILAGAAAAVILMLLGGAHWMRLSRLDAEIADLNAQENNLNAAIKEGAPESAAYELVAAWKAGGEDWLEEFVTLTDRMPKTDRVYVESLRCLSRQGPTSSPKIIVKGFARKREDALKLNDLFLAADGHFQGQPVREEATKKKDDEFYKWEFEKELRLMTAKSGPGDAKSRKAKTNFIKEPTIDSGASPGSQPPTKKPAAETPGDVGRAAP